MAATRARVEIPQDSARGAQLPDPPLLPRRRHALLPEHPGDLYPALVDEFGAPFNTSSYRCLHFGFSIGGSLGADIVARYDAVLAGVNYDGIFIDSHFSNMTADVRKPFLVFRDDQGREATDPAWDWFQGNQTGWWRRLKVLGSHHLDFSDVGLWFELLGVNDNAAVDWDY
ncbi:hypothetical protein diail_6994 [Diaporthe ilicicola]|nr:hypothetical protein diail_6994 [Diaporthe ilicicola]